MTSVSVSSEDGFDDHLESYSLSADVSESESSASDIPHCHWQWQYRDPEGSVSGSSSPSASENSSEFSPSVSVLLPVIAGQHVPISPKKIDKQDTDVSAAEVELMKERFAKLLLGEDMSGGGKGVCTALAISNAITNLCAGVFGELWKLEPLAPQKKALWRREMELLLSVSDSIIELVPSIQVLPGGGTIEVMVPQPRSDLYRNLRALKKIDAMLLSILDGFYDTEFYYVDRGAVLAGSDERKSYPVSTSSSMPSAKQEEKWWLPFPKVPPNGLSEDSRRRLQKCREWTNQIFKAAMAINSSVLAEMEIPEAYLESLPKSGKACLGEITYHYFKADNFSLEALINHLDLSSEYTIQEIANRIEASAHIWKLKYLKRRSSCVKIKRSPWSGKFKTSSSSVEKRRILAERAESLLRKLRLRFPGLPQTALDVSKIQYNKDVGHAILESYSRVMESLAFNIMARIDDLLHIDDAIKHKEALESSLLNNQERFRGSFSQRKLTSPSPLSIHHTAFTLPTIYPSSHRLGFHVDRLDMR